VSLTDSLIDEHDDLWQEMLQHDFLAQMRDRTLDDERFKKWLRQDYEFVAAALPFVSAIKPKAPDEHLRPLAEAEVALHDELDLFEERADALGVSVEDVSRNLTTQSYIQHLMATAYREDYPVALAVYWAAEKAYHESWKQVAPGLDEDHPWHPFVQNWAGDEFGEFVEFLGTALEAAAAGAADDRIQRLNEQFRWTVRYEIAFWDMAYGRSGEEWIRVRF
jgi:thiaminase/transcriptional activator TenA